MTASNFLKYILFFSYFISHVNVLEKLSYINKILCYEIKLKHYIEK